MVGACAVDPGKTWVEERETRIMDLLASLGRYANQDADSASRHRSYRWLEALWARTANILRLEAEAMRNASARGGG